jgi:mono/diheme cytochrome c family protein
MVNPRKAVAVGILVAGVALFVLLHAAAWYLGRGIVLPEVENVEVVTLDQNWTAADRQWFYHTSQGGAFALLLRYPWLMAMEQPRLPWSIVGPVPLFMADDYITRFGFLPNPRERYSADSITFGWAIDAHSPAYAATRNNPDRLPVGFARTPEFMDPDDGKRYDVIGFTCAACHTGQLNYRGRGVRIEGGPALTNLTKFEQAVGLSLALTYLIPQRFDRFADAVLGEDHTRTERSELRGQLGLLIKKGEDYEALVKGPPAIYPTEEGFGRLDALGRIGNFVFGMEVDEANMVVADGPVNYPHVWDTPWFDWVQYNGSIKQPIIRNAGESMGVFADVNFDPADTTRLFDSTIMPGNLYEMESLIRGPAPFEGLKPPKWPEEIFGAIDRDLAARGRELYSTHCQGCHHPVRSETPPYLPDQYWTEVDSFGNRYLDLKLVNLYEIGTDPKAAVNFAQRVVNLGELGERFREEPGRGGLRTAGDALPFLVSRTVDRKFDQLGLPDSLRDLWRGLRPNDIRAPLAYMARPLNGVWASPPFLHNGAVPTIHQLLSPHAERDARFWLGSKEYDPVNVGYTTRRVRGGFQLDTSLPGNSNRGHQFEGDFDPTAPGFNWNALPSGVIGPGLSPDERMALIEYLKSI